MIRIQILKTEEIPADPTLIADAETKALEKLIDAENATWRTRAKNETERFRAAKKYLDNAEFWGDIKGVYMRLQANKCAYCEQKLEDKKIVHDVEHFRPKGSVKVWLTKSRKAQHKFDFPDAPSDLGYYLLPYHPLNYVTACKQCNSSLKSNCFPIAGSRLLDNDDFSVINKSEKPFLPFPLGHVDEDAPEDLISFVGVVPVINPELTDEHKKLRAHVTIKFFNLDKLRETLIKQRCKVIKDVYEAIEFVNNSNNPLMVEQKKEDLRQLTAGKEAHTNCAVSFYKLCLNDTAKAREHWIAANEYIRNHPEK